MLLPKNGPPYIFSSGIDKECLTLMSVVEVPAAKNYINSPANRD